MRIPFALVVLLANPALAQQVDSLTDSARVLNEVTIQAYAYNRPPLEVPASVGIVNQAQLQRFNNTSLVPSFNTVAGVRMEERSPGSYRLAIRGSSLRAPFGVRNVKVYWNNLPLTDAGGNTYLNQLDFNAVQKAEIIKGPGSSLYGAGTGGVVLLNGRRTQDESKITMSTMGGSYGMVGYNAAFLTSEHTVQFNHLQSDGYRAHTRLIRDMLNWQGRFTLDNKQEISTSIFYTDLFYETPGALTLAEFKSNPRQARPGADQRNPQVHAKALWTGVMHSIDWSEKWSSSNGVYGNFVQFQNPSFRNYERRAEQGVGARSITRFIVKHKEIQWTVNAGGEFQIGFIPSKVYNNTRPDSLVLQQDDELSTNLYLLFAQIDATFKKGFSVTIGASYSKLKYYFIRLSDDPDTDQNIFYTPVLSPRLAVLKKFGPNFSMYTSISKGFSPPSYAEVYPSQGTFNTALAPENGYNYEAGLKGRLFNKKLNTELTVYQFNMEETIVLRRATDNAEYFVNAGKTSQRGVEISVAHEVDLGMYHLNMWTSYAYQHYRFKNYQQDQTDLSGNALTGVPASIFNGGIDIESKKGVYVRTTINHTSKLPLNDANSVYADAYLLLGARSGYKRKRFEVYVGSENLLDETYSLGNDINAFGGRYYNAAPARSFYGGVVMDLKLK